MKSTSSKILIFAATVALLAVFSQSAAALVEVKLVTPEKFRDIDISGKTQKQSIAHVHENLTKLFQSLADDALLEQNNLLIEVTDVDLAGYIDPMYGPSNRSMRIVRNNDFYKLKFRFEIKNDKGEVIKQGDKQIKEFLSRQITKFNSAGINSVSYLEKDLKKWFKQEFAK